MAKDFEFSRPPAGPTFYPTAEEFANPLEYINTIRPKAQAYGICKIKPPADWTPRFAVDENKFKFFTRVQKIREIEATTRVKLNFMDKITQFWTLQGKPLDLPVMVDNKTLDLHDFHRLANGCLKQRGDKKWDRIAMEMNLQSDGGKSIGVQLKAIYDQILYPFDEWQSNKENQETDQETSKDDNRFKNKWSDRTRRQKTKTKRTEPLKNYTCPNCKEESGAKNKTVLCIGCEKRYHIQCLKPALDHIPKEWRCLDCVEENIGCSYDGFGFEQSSTQYTLRQFEKKANSFKTDYFKKPLKSISGELIEKEFWRIASTDEEEITVEYGADLRTTELGSAFPTESNASRYTDEDYVNSGWNLNKLPVLRGSAFGHVNVEISGMTSPWMYVGMCFSTFCWHTEDHWSYSINYLHCGEPKTWYGVPGDNADDFERTMKASAPELFLRNPDLLHGLVTLMNPNILMAANVPVYRMDQNAGEFIITFPRAYHAGFNQGYNFAEAANFAPADWVPMGRKCVLHYSGANRECVFSHDELVCSMAAEPKKLDFSIAVAVREDMMKMIQIEDAHRKDVEKWGVKVSENVLFEQLADDRRQCSVCKTTLYLSAVVCNHHSEDASEKDTKMVCLKHYDQYGCDICKMEPANYILKYRHSIEDLRAITDDLECHIKNYGAWIETLKETLSPTAHKISLEKLRGVVGVAHTNEFTHANLNNAEKVLNEAERIITDFEKHIASFISAQGEAYGEIRKARKLELRMVFECTFDKLQSLMKKTDSCPVYLPEMELCATLYKKASIIQKKAIELYQNASASLADMLKCLEDALDLNVGCQEIHQLESKYKMENWIRVAGSYQVDDVNKRTFNRLWKVIEDGNRIIYRDAKAETILVDLSLLLEQCFEWEYRATPFFENPWEHGYCVEARKLIEDGMKIPMKLPSMRKLKRAYNAYLANKSPNSKKRKLLSSGEVCKRQCLYISDRMD